MEKKRAVFRRSVRKFTEQLPVKRFKDTLVAEEPFTVTWESNDGESERLASTMRTPGDDPSLAAGMLFSEGVVLLKREIHVLSFCAGGAANELNRLKAELRLSGRQIRARLGHRPSAVMPQSACGLCAADDLSNPKVLLDWAQERYRGAPVEPTHDRLREALAYLEESCPLFSVTGASHACVIVDRDGGLLSASEDVGRHNACDKALGGLLLDDDANAAFQLPPGSGLVVSSRFSFELAHKAAAAGASWMASVGAPTHLAVELAERCGIPMFGFLSRRRVNRYV